MSLLQLIIYQQEQRQGSHTSSCVCAGSNLSSEGALALFNSWLYISFFSAGVALTVERSQDSGKPTSPITTPRACRAGGRPSPLPCAPRHRLRTAAPRASEPENPWSPIRICRRTIARHRSRVSNRLTARLIYYSYRIRQQSASRKA